MKDIDKFHIKEYGQSPEIVIEVPQLTTFLGAFSDYISGYAIMTTNDSGLRVAVSRRDDNLVRAYNVSRQDKKKFTVTSVRYRKEDRWANVFKAIISELSVMGFSLGGLNITLKGENAASDNTSYTAAAFSGFLSALDSLYSLGLSGQEKLMISLRANMFAPEFNARKRDLVMLFSGLSDKVVLFDLDSYEYRAIDYPFNNKGLSLKSVFVSPSLPFSVLTPEEDEFRRDIIELSKKLRVNLPRGVKLRDLTERELRPVLINLSETQKRYARYLIEESQNAKAGWDCLVKGDVDGFSRALNQQQNNITSKAELTTPEIDWIVRRGNENRGIHALSQVYVGIAGMMFSIIDKDLDLKDRGRFDEYERIFGFHPQIRDYNTSLGLRKIQEND